ncbi:hypothetical protein BS78_07G217400 [Paspalum vaginatum]|nr:hypothetical protein BS78_07G217400 [Paspalum vaginatum]
MHVYELLCFGYFSILLSMSSIVPCTSVKFDEAQTCCRAHVIVIIPTRYERTRNFCRVPVDQHGLSW